VRLERNRIDNFTKFEEELNTGGDKLAEQEWMLNIFVNKEM
jgi:uncharacterized protein YmfQ (DUF2313 family)